MLTASQARQLAAQPHPPVQPLSLALATVQQRVETAARRQLYTVALPFIPSSDMIAALSDLGYHVTHHQFNPEDRFSRISPWVISWRNT